MAELRPTVAILTYGAHPALAYGTLLVFKSLRVGFPTARIEVYDNGSHPDVRDQVMKACADVDATFIGMSPIHWANHYRWLLHSRPHDGGPLVLVDPDVVFWKCVEDWEFGQAVMAGRLIPGAAGEQLVGHARLHPSLLWIEDVDRWRREVPPSAIAQDLQLVDGRVNFWDTFARAYQLALPRCQAFAAAQLDCYDHLFFGTHLPMIDAHVGPSFDVIRDGHAAAAAGELERLRGAWRRQDEYFSCNAYSEVRERATDVLTRQLACLQGLQRLQGASYLDGELLTALASMAARMHLGRA